MPATLYLRPQPRAFYLLTTTHALIFRQPDASESKASRSVVVAEFLPVEEVDMRGLVRASKGRTVEGVLGVTSVPTDRSPVPDIFLLLVSYATPLSPLLPSSSLRPAKVTLVEFHSLSSPFWDPPDLAPSGYSFETDLDDPYDPASTYHAGPSTTQSVASSQGVENPCNGMRKYLESGSFFFAEGCKWDISSRMGEENWMQAERGASRHPLETFDERFVWNSSLLAPFIAFRSGLPAEVRAELDDQSLLIPVIQGYCGSHPVTTGTWNEGGKPELAALGMISRLSWKRAGARFRTRGIDDDGQVANFVETELILATDSVCLSYSQVRGSVPLFWQQPSQGLQTLQQRVELTRPPQATQPAFDKHFLDLLEHYHSVHAINLLGQKDAEAMLSSAYSDHVKQLKGTLDQSTSAGEKDLLNGASLSLTPYDFHAAIRIGGHESVKYDFQNKLHEVIHSAEDFGWTAVDTSSGQIIEQQRGVFRTNCLDCLDRTNYVQDVISSLTLSRFLSSVESPLLSSPALWGAHRELWADNGDRLSKIYAGTGALNTSATRSGKKTFAGLLSDATKSVSRAYINNFQDKDKQANIDMLLGMMAGQRPVILFDPINDSVQSALQARVNEYSKTRNYTIFSGTWNLNGKPPSESLDAWLFPPNSSEPDIYMIAFQEIVELSPGQILQTDPNKRRMWEMYIMDSFAQREGKQTEYLLYRSEQLVGAALIIVVKSSLTSHIRNVESSTKKTGLSGLSGNKGGVGIRFELHDSTICLMTCHLAAGHANVAERNADYKTISGGFKFLRGKMIDDHEIIIWAADFNYRIGLPNLDAREYAGKGQLDALMGADQLLQAMDDGEVFLGYDEGPITFRPTYKYDNGTDIYDSSEKARIPAWTDRILFKGPALRLKEYKRAELRTSDHRPVYAIFDATVRQVDRAKKEAIAKEIMHEIRPSSGTTMDATVEKVVGVNGLGGIVGRVSTPSTLSSRAASPAVINVPKLPPRPNASITVKVNDALTTSLNSRDTQPSNGLVKAAIHPLMVTPGLNGAAIPRKPAPPIPVRQPTSSSIFSTTPPSTSYRVTPPNPRSSSVLSSDDSQPLSSSPTMSASSTGSYMVIKSPPPLPIRARPEPRKTLDMDGSPPGGLIAPVVPDRPGSATSGSRTTGRAREIELSTSPETSKLPTTPEAAKSPPVKSSKPSIPPKKPVALASTSESQPDSDPPEPSKKVGDLKKMFEQGAKNVGKKSLVDKPDLEKSGPPVVAKKPPNLRSASGAA